MNMTPRICVLLIKSMRTPLLRLDNQERLAVQTMHIANGSLDVSGARIYHLQSHIIRMD